MVVVVVVVTAVVTMMTIMMTMGTGGTPPQFIRVCGSLEFPRLNRLIVQMGPL